nr:diaminopropionate ammonia-lyase [Gorillibacterium massiliense]
MGQGVPHMSHSLKTVVNPRVKKDSKTRITELFGDEEIGKAVRFHRSFPQYKPTPLVSLNHLAERLQIKGIYVKDESFRFGLGSFKVLGGSYAIGRLIAEKAAVDPGSMTFEGLKSDAIREKSGDMVFVTATDGNHGRGVAWTASQLGHRSVVYMPKGSSPIRLQHIRDAGAEASITDWNYDDSVRIAASEAEKHGWEVIQDTSWKGYVEVPLHIMQGYATMAQEALSQLKENEAAGPTHVFVQAGVGAFAGAVVGYLNAKMEKSPKVIVVEPNKADCLYRTCKADDGQLHRVEGDMDTIMAGLACGEPNPLGWEVLREYADVFASVPDSVAALGMRVLGNPLQGDQRVISGESGAVTAGLLSMVMEDENYAQIREEIGLDADSVVLLFNTEGDTDPDMYRKVVWNGNCKVPEFD